MNVELYTTAGKQQFGQAGGTVSSYAAATAPTIEDLSRRIQKLEEIVKEFEKQNQDLGKIRYADKPTEFRGGIRVRGNQKRPPIHIVAGDGVPSLALPNGSMFLRTDGGAGTTLYVREAGNWSTTA